MTTTRWALILCLALGACGRSGYLHETRWESITDQDGKTLYRYQESGVETLAQVRGQARVDVTGTRLLGFEEGGRLDLRVFRAGADPDSGWVAEVLENEGGLRRTVREKGAIREWSEEDETRLQSVLEVLLTRTSFGAESRVQALMAAGGPQAVLDAYEGVQSPSAQEVFLTAILAEEPLDPRYLVEVARALRTFSSHSRAHRLASAMVDREPTHEELTRALLDVTRGLASSSYRADLITTVARRRRLSTEDIAYGCTLAREIPSGSARVGTLVELLEATPDLAGVEGDYLSTVRSLPASSQRVQALGALLEHRKADERTRQAILRIVGEIPSSEGRGEVLFAVLEDSSLESPGFLDLFLDRVGELPSTHLRARLLEAVLERPELSRAQVKRLSSTVAELPSAQERDRLQQRMIERLSDESSED